MANLFCADEIIKIGIKIRDNGKNFYTKIARTSESKEVEETFKWLAQEEDKHIKVLNEIAERVNSCEQFEQYDEEYSAYVQVLINKHALAKTEDVNKMLASIKTNADAIKLAETFENDSVQFLKEMKKFVRQKEARIIADLIKGEQQQLLRLSKLKKCLMDSDLKACLLA